MKLADDLRSIAQNNFMIDQYYLPDGETLYHAAEELERMEKTLVVMRASLVDGTNAMNAAAVLLEQMHKGRRITMTLPADEAEAFQRAHTLGEGGR